MRRNDIKPALIAIVGGLAMCAALAMPLGGCRRQPAGPAAATTSSGAQVAIAGRGVWTVELAVTAERRSKGLAGRDSLAAGHGMLFVFSGPVVRDFWMEGCHIPLDIAFISPDMRVVKTYRMAVEADRKGHVLYSSQAPAQYALEMPAGELDRAGVRAGDSVSLTGIPEAVKAQADP